MAHTHYTVGEGYSSATIQAAIDLIPGNLASDGGGVQNVDVYYCDADDHSVAYAEALDIQTGFSNASATDYIDVGAMVSHCGMRDSGIIVDCGQVANFWCIYLTNYTRLHDLCITASTYPAAGENHVICSDDYSRIYNNYIYDWDGKTNTSAILCAYWVGVKAYNNIIVNTVTVAPQNWGIVMGNSSLGSETDIHNNTILLSGGSSRGIFDWYGSDYIRISNNYCYGTTNFSFYNINSNTHGYLNYNISSDGTADDFGGTGNLVSKAAVDQFECVTAGSENLQLRYTSACYRKGQDNSSLFTTDCAGNTWNHWETGALAKQYARIYNVDGDETDQITSNGVIIP